MSRPGRERGVGLIEVLVSVLVLSIGLLGIAWVQTRALSNNNSSMARSMAVVASYSILDAMRADRVRAMAGDYDVADMAANNCPAAGSLAQTQLRNWCLELGATLGAVASTKGTVDCDTEGECTITVTFDDSRIGEGGTGSQTVVTKGML
ncbi:type IV pilus modification protein PilV [Sinimarinibacterium flocculans]|uniref:type IV pilus modification protein PilV n=1 Tax=Sinimarinibacterium flocculans TaxID=985250 RepID=UPI0035174EE6